MRFPVWDPAGLTELGEATLGDGVVAVGIGGGFIGLGLFDTLVEAAGDGGEVEPFCDPAEDEPAGVVGFGEIAFVHGLEEIFAGLGDAAGIGVEGGEGVEGAEGGVGALDGLLGGLDGLCGGAGFDEFGPGDSVVVLGAGVAGGGERVGDFAGGGKLALGEGDGQGGAESEGVVWELIETLLDDGFGFGEALQFGEGGDLPLERGFGVGVEGSGGAGGGE